MQKLRVKTVILSDVHLGTTDCRVREVNHFLKNVRCEKLILNGDIIEPGRMGDYELEDGDEVKCEAKNYASGC